MVPTPLNIRSGITKLLTNKKTFSLTMKVGLFSSMLYDDVIIFFLNYLIVVKFKFFIFFFLRFSQEEIQKQVETYRSKLMNQGKNDATKDEFGRVL